MGETKQFHIADLVTITDGRLVSPRHIAADSPGWFLWAAVRAARDGDPAC